MSEIPDDIKQTAITAWKDGTRMSIRRVGHPWEPIARAILAERERCAKRLEDKAVAIEEAARTLRVYGKTYAYFWTQIAIELRKQVAAIRGGSHE